VEPGQHRSGGCAGLLDEMERAVDGGGLVSTTFGRPCKSPSGLNTGGGRQGAPSQPSEAAAGAIEPVTVTVTPHLAGW
jgi:hypothetical protein